MRRRSIRFAWAFPGARLTTTTAMKTMTEDLPEGAQWAGFGISAMEMPMVAQAVLLGGHVRVGLEDNLYLEKRRLRQQWPAGREGDQDHRDDGRTGGHAFRGPRES